MYNTLINFSKRVRQNLLAVLQTPRRLDRIYAAIKPIRVMYEEFKLLKAEYLYKVRFNGAVNYLESALNDQFDSTLRRIYIDDANFPIVYIFRKAELKPPSRLYRKWTATIAFTIGQYCFYNGAIYQTTTNNTNKIPGVDADWVVQPALSAPLIYRHSNFTGEISFYVMVPVSLVFDTDEMNKLIKYYKLAGPGYKIKTF